MTSCFVYIQLQLIYLSTNIGGGILKSCKKLCSTGPDTRSQGRDVKVKDMEIQGVTSSNPGANVTKLFTAVRYEF